MTKYNFFTSYTLSLTTNCLWIKTEAVRLAISYREYWRVPFYTKQQQLQQQQQNESGHQESIDSNNHRLEHSKKNLVALYLV